MKYLLLLLLLPIAITPAFADNYRGATFLDEDLGNTQHRIITALPPYLDTGILDEFGRTKYIPYNVIEDSTHITVESGNTSWTFDKQTCTLRLYDYGKVTGSKQPIIENISYTMQEKINNVWTNTPHNNYTCQTTTTQFATQVLIVAKQGDNNIGFKEIHLKQNAGEGLEVILYSPVDSIGGRIFGFAESQVKTQDVSVKGKKYGLDISDNIVIPKGNFTYTDQNGKHDQKVLVDTPNGKLFYNSKDSIHNSLTDVTIKKYTPTKLQVVYDFHNTKPLTQGSRLEIDPYYALTTGTTDTGLTASSVRGFGNRIESGHSLIGQTVTRIDIAFKTAQTGTITVGAWDSSDVLKATFGTKDASTLTGSYVWYTFQGSQVRTIATNDRLGWSMSGSSTGTTTQRTSASAAANLGGGSINDAGVWSAFDPNQDHNMIIYYYTTCGAPTLNAAATQSSSAIDLRWSKPATSCYNTNYKVYQSVSGGTYTLLTTLGNTTSYSVTGLDSAKQYSYKVSTNNTLGYSSNSTVKTNSTLPGTPVINNVYGYSKTQVNIEFSDNSVGSVINWFKARWALASGGSWNNITTNSSIPTPRVTNATGLSEGQQINIQVAEGNQGGWSAWSSNATARTIATTSGTLSFLSQTIGDTVQLNGTIGSIVASPTPQTATQLMVYDNGTLAKTETISVSLPDSSTANFDPIYYQITDSNVHALALKITATNGTGTTTISSSASNFTWEYDPDYFTATDSTQGLVNYTSSRTSDDDTINLKINRDKNGNTFNVECLYQTTAQVSYFGTGGTWHNYTGIGFVNDTYNDAAGKILYITCYNDGLLFTVTNYNNSTSLLLTGIEAFDNVYGGFIGVPVGVFFLVLVAGYANQRTAPMWIIIILAIAGVMSAIGIIDLDTNVWALALIAGLLGLLVGRKFF